MRHFKVTFEFTRIVESDDHDAVEDWATVVWHRIYPDFKAIYNKKGVQVLGPDLSERTELVTVKDLGEVR
jgi:hypothetical protein